MSAIAVHTTVYYETILCYSCGCAIALDSTFIKNRRDDHHGFFCPNGHNNYFPGLSEAEKLKVELADKERQLTAQRARVSELNMQITKADRATARLKKRVRAGVCPCCQRTFKQLAAHMTCKHPDYAEPKS